MKTLFYKNKEKKSLYLLQLLQYHVIKYLIFFFLCRSFTENVGPIKSDASQKGGMSAQQLVQEIMSQTGGCRFYIFIQSQTRVFSLVILFHTHLRVLHASS